MRNIEIERHIEHMDKPSPNAGIAFTICRFDLGKDFQRTPLPRQNADRLPRMQMTVLLDQDVLPLGTALRVRARRGEQAVSLRAGKALLPLADGELLPLVNGAMVHALTTRPRHRVSVPPLLHRAASL